MTLTEYKVVYSPEAFEDLKSIYRYIAIDLQEMETAKNQTERIRRTIRDLSVFPEKHKIVDWKPWSDMNMRQVPVNNYVAFYLVDNEKKIVTVTRIFYGGRDIRKLI